jgi:hypothetical protein
MTVRPKEMGGAPSGVSFTAHCRLIAISACCRYRAKIGGIPYTGTIANEAMHGRVPGQYPHSPERSRHGGEQSEPLKQQPYAEYEVGDDDGGY